MRELLVRCKAHFFYAGVFSFFINLLLLTVPLYMLLVYDRVLTSRSTDTLMLLTLLAVAALLIHFWLETLRSRLLLSAGVALDAMAAPPVLEGVLKGAVRPGLNPDVAGLKDLAIVRGFLTGGSICALFDSPWLPLYLGMIFLFHWWLGVIATLGAAALAALAILNEKLTRAPLGKMTEEARRAGVCIDAGVRNAEAVYALGMLGDLQRRWQRFNSLVIDAQVDAGRAAGLCGGATRFVRLAIQVVMLAAGAMLVIEDQTTAAVMIAGTLILARALAPVESAILTWKSLVEARAAYHRLEQSLAGAAQANPCLELPAPAGGVELERVVFALPGGGRTLLKGLSFALAPGESLGLVGPSASGKSTLARLIIGLWQASAGAVRLDGADVARWPRSHLGRHIGYLPQDAQLFSGTIGENIARLKDASAEEIVAAAKRAAAHELILRLPKGYDTEVGADGAALSGGQRQRIGLARALFRGPKLVVLDEPNANLDSDGEAALLEAMRALREAGATLIVISHRPSLLADVDKLLVLKDGQIDLFGPRAEVMARLNRNQRPQVHPVRELIPGGRT
ncbi:MAG: type I secretion system permease/ATPase [Burkholderiales bacterium]